MTRDGFASKIKNSVLRFLVFVTVFTFFFGYGTFFVLSHVQEFSNTNISYLVGTGIFTVISISGLTNPGAYITVFKIFGFLMT